MKKIKLVPIISGQLASGSGGLCRASVADGLAGAVQHKRTDGPTDTKRFRVSYGFIG